MASKQHAIEKELLEALKQKPHGAKEKRATFLKRLHEAATECDEKVWDNLTEAAQAWVNAATEAHDKDKAYPDFGAKAEEETAEAEEPAKAAKGEKAAKGKAKEAKEPEPKKTAKANGKAKPAKAAKKESAEAGYKGHRAGSRKEGIHKLYDEKGADAATKKAVALGLSEGTAKSWIGAWKRADA